MKPDQERVRSLLSDTVTLLCKNGLQFNKELRVQGLLGITLDDADVFVVHINETFGQLADDSPEETAETTTENDISNNSISASRHSQSGHISPDLSKPRHRKSRHRYGSGSPQHVKPRENEILSVETNPPVHIKKETNDQDDVMVVESKSTSFHQAGMQHVPDNYGSSSDGSMLGFGQGYSDDLGPPTAKRKAQGMDSYSGDINSGSYMKNSQSGSMDMSGMGQMGDDGSMMLEGSSAQWDPSQGTSTSQALGQHPDSNNQDAAGMRGGDVGLDYWYPEQTNMHLLSHPKQHADHGTSGNKSVAYQCVFEGCKKVFSHTSTVYRHQRATHNMASHGKGQRPSVAMYKTIEL